MNYKTYAEAKIDNPGCEIVTTGKDWSYNGKLAGLFQALDTSDEGQRIHNTAWVICNPANHCSTLKEFLDAGFKLNKGDYLINVWGNVSVAAGIADGNLPDGCGHKRYILSAAALMGGSKIPDKVELWTIYSNALPLSDLSDEQAAQLFNAWRAGGNVECDSFCDEWLCADDCLWVGDRVYRIKQKSKRELFIGASIKLVTPENYESMDKIFGAQFDAGARYTDLTQHFGENI